MIKPVNDKVLIEFIEGQDIKKSGIIITHKKEDRPQIAQVLAAGEKTTQVSKGDMVVVSRYIGEQFKDEGKEYVILKEKDILAKVEM